MKICEPMNSKVAWSLERDSLHFKQLHSRHVLGIFCPSSLQTCVFSYCRPIPCRLNREDSCQKFLLWSNSVIVSVFFKITK